MPKLFGKGGVFKMQSAAKPSKNTRRLLFAVIIVAAFCLMLKLFPAIFSPSVPPVEHGYAKVCFLDTGQSDCSLILTENATVLIDCGEIGCERTVCTLLKKYGVKTIDIFVVTHPHSDHIGTASAVFSEFEVKRLLLPEIPREYISDTQLYDELLSSAKAEKGCVVSFAKPGDVFSFEDNSRLIVLGPIDCYFDNINNWSVVTKFVFGETSFLFTGDMEASAEADLIASGADISCNVLKIGHHGSRTSSTDDFLSASNPDFGLILCGSGNVHGHPHDGVKQALKAHKIKVFRTDLDGTVTMSTNGSEISVETEK